LEQLGEEELTKVVPKRLAGRIKRRFSGETSKVQDVSCVSSPPPRRERTKVGVSLNTNDQGLTTNPSYNSQLASCTLQPVLEIDIHRPDRIIFEGEKIGVTAKEFSLIHLMAENRGKILTHNDLLDTIWKGSVDATYTHITFHLSKIRRDILKTIGNNKKNKERVKDILKVISRRGVMLNLEEEKLKIS